MGRHARASRSLNAGGWGRRHAQQHTGRGSPFALARGVGRRAAQQNGRQGRGHGASLELRPKHHGFGSCRSTTRLDSRLWRVQTVETKHEGKDRRKAEDRHSGRKGTVASNCPDRGEDGGQAGAKSCVKQNPKCICTGYRGSITFCSLWLRLWFDT